MNDKLYNTWPPIINRRPFCSSNYHDDTSDSLKEFADEANRFVIRARLGSESTQRAYAGDWQRFACWCEIYRKNALPAEPYTLCSFLVYLAREKKISTIQRYLAAISKTHKLAKLPNPVLDSSVKELFDGIKL